MKKRFAFGTAFLVLMAVSASYYAFFVPKIGHATRAEIEAALPPSLKEEDAPDPSGEARYARLIEITKRLDLEQLPASGRKGSAGRSTSANEATLREVDALIRQGDLRVPEARGDVMYPELTYFKNAAKLMALAASDALRRGDRSACGRWATIGLRYARSLEGSGGVVIQQLVAVAVNGIATRAAYLAEIDGGLADTDRERILALLPPRDGSSPAMAEAMRRDFVWGWLPVLLDPKGHEKELTDDGSMDDLDGEPRPKPPLVGTYDPVATARLAGAIYDATITDLRRPANQARHDDERLMQAAGKGLPTRPTRTSEDDPSQIGVRLRYRAAMNAGANTLGRQQASQSALVGMGGAAARQATNDNLLRTVILLRMGRPMAVPDPYGKGNLRFDPMRKIVWSVGKDGKDDGGRIGKGFENDAPDLGCPYGDHGWEALHPKLP